MRDIIVAVDFSESSINSVKHALSIAQKARANIDMVWVNKHNTSKSLIGDRFNEQISEATRKFDELIAEFQPQLPHSKIGYKIRNGRVYKEIVAEAFEKKADLIVTGTHGSSGFEQFLIGSNAYKVIASSPCPTITIREDIKIERNLERIVLPLDHTLETRQKVGITTRFAKYFNAEVHVLGLYTSSVVNDRYRVDGYIDQVKKHFDEFEIPFKTKTVKCDNPTTATIDFAVDVDANLITIMSEQVTATANLWLGSYAQQMVNKSPMPVLTIRSKQIYDYQAK